MCVCERSHDAVFFIYTRFSRERMSTSHDFLQRRLENVEKIAQHIRVNFQLDWCEHLVQKRDLNAFYNRKYPGINRPVESTMREIVFTQKTIVIA